MQLYRSRFLAGIGEIGVRAGSNAAVPYTSNSPTLLTPRFPLPKCNFDYSVFHISYL